MKLTGSNFCSRGLSSELNFELTSIYQSDVNFFNLDLVVLPSYIDFLGSFFLRIYSLQFLKHS
jgi:hypothetical protein